MNTKDKPKRPLPEPRTMPVKPSSGQPSRDELRTDGLIAEIMSLQELRKLRQQTQVQLAEILGITQENISRIETRQDLLVSTLRRQVEALGGRLSLIAKFPDHPSVELIVPADPDDKSPA